MEVRDQEGVPANQEYRVGEETCGAVVPPSVHDPFVGVVARGAALSPAAGAHLAPAAVLAEAKFPRTM